MKNGQIFNTSPQVRTKSAGRVFDQAALTTQGMLAKNATARRPRTLGHSLMQEGVVSAQEMIVALRQFERKRTSISEAVLSSHATRDTKISAATAKHWDVKNVEDLLENIDMRLVDMLGVKTCLRDGILPWRSCGEETVIVVADVQTFLSQRAGLTGLFGPLRMAVAPYRDIEAALLRLRGAQLAEDAETSVAVDLSCRTFSPKQVRQSLAGLLVLLSLAIAFDATATLTILTLIALTAMLAFTGLKLASGVTVLMRPRPTVASNVQVFSQPVVSVMVAMYKESDIAPRLVRRLSRLDYPRDLLDIILVVEAEDEQTRTALRHSCLPTWMRVVVVPKGAVKTKPRALNYALDQCRGSIIGVYDAEDAPDPSQIRKVVQRFHESTEKVACLQGVLDFYNPETNWLSRCFTIEYATWFRIFLPGIERLGFAVPLGGTTLFFRREALEKLGKWDAYNVTEDADLGMRLARCGYRTELIDTVTEEEANCRTWPWVKQRSRWIKGFMMTWATHMRAPVKLWRELGPKQFLGFQILLLGSILQQLMAPLLWSFWVLPFGLHHPVASFIPHWAFLAMMGSFFTAEAIALVIGVAALRKTKHRLSWWWVPTLIMYHPLATISAYKGLYELLTKPFYWDKTSHGHFDANVDVS